MTTQIKITQLTNIGSANTTVTTLLPVVNMAGTPTTQKTTLGNLANVILSQSGGNYVPANLANVAYSVTNAAQPNITSVGTLTNLAISGNITVNGNITSNGTAYVGNISTTGLASITTLNVGATANLGAVGNVKITGGTSGYVLQTDGAGNLSWTAQTGGGGNATGIANGTSSVTIPVVNSNVLVQAGTNVWTFGANGVATFPSGMTIERVTSPETATALIDGNGIVIATTFGNAVQVENSNVTIVANSKSWHFTGDGNLSLPNVANASINYANGSPYVVSLLSAFGSNTITTTGNVSVGNIIGNGQALTGIAGANVSGTVGNANLAQYLNVTDVNNNFSYHVALSAGSGDKSLHIDADDNLQYNPADGILTVNRVDADFLEVQNSVITNLIPFDNLGLSLGNATNPWQDLYLSNSTLYLGDATITANGNSIVVDSITINNGNVGTIGNIASINLTGSNSNVLYGNGVFAAITGGGGNGTPGGSNTQIQFNDNGNFGANSGFTFDSATGNIGIPGIIIGSNTIEFDNRATGNSADINLYSADDILIQARDRAIGSTSEGGDINIYAGDSAEDSDSSGGDVVIEAGNGGAANVDYGGSGGFIRIEAGRGGAASTEANGFSALSGGQLTLNAGDGGTNNGNVSRGASGGDVSINAGDSTGSGQTGGDIFLTTGLGGGNALAGRVQIITPSSATANGGTWTFDGNGNLTLPANTFAVNYANGTQVSIGGGSGNTGNVTFDGVAVQGSSAQLFLSPDPDFTANLAYVRVRAGDVPSHIHMDTGNNEAYDLIIGDDQNFVQVSSTGNIIMSSYDSNTSQYIWTLDTTGNLILAGGNSVIQSVANSSLDPLNPNVSTMTLTPDANYSSQSLVLDPTAPGHIHLRAPGANIDEPLANIFLGGEDSSFEVGYYNGSAPNVFIHSGGNTWTFSNDGNLTTPSNLVIGPTGFGGTGFTQSDAPLLLGSSEANGRASLVWFENPTGPGNIVQVGLNDSTPGSMTVTTGDLANTSYVWDFDNTGNLTLPSGGNLIVSGSIVGSGASPAPTLSGFSSVSALQFTNGNSNVTINANSNTWRFDSTGNLTLPGNTVAIKLANGSSAFGNITTINLNGNTSQVLLGNGAFAAIPTSSIIANGNSNVSIASSNGNVVINSVGNTTMTVTGTGANVTGTLTSTGKIGYASGSTVTQSTNRGTSVTINSLAGTIVTVSASMVAGFIDTFGVSNDQVDPNNDIVLVQIVSPNFGMYNVIAQPSAIINGFNNGFFLNIQNISGGPSSNEAITIRFMVIKAPNA
jgi:hypothetical protein